jgi:hypothetical protein
LRCEENRNYLKDYLIDLENARIAEERAAKEAAFQELDIDLDNLDALPDKLVLKPNMGKKPRKPRAPRDPAKGPIVRRKRINEKDIIIAENSEKDTAAYVRKIITTPEQSLEVRGTSKRKSKHVIIQDIEIASSTSRAIENTAKNGVKQEKSESKSVIYTTNDESSEQKGTNESTKTESEAPSESDVSEQPAPKKNKPTIKTVRDDDEPVFEDDSDFEEDDEEEEVAPKRAKRSSNK